MVGTAAGHSARMAIYSDAGIPMPNMQLGITATFPTAAGAMQSTITPPVNLTAGTYYWIAAISDTDIGLVVDSGGPGYFANNNPSGWSTFPTTFPSGGSLDSTQTPHFYAVLRNQ
jgi:hypothetical protein